MREIKFILEKIYNSILPFFFPSLKASFTVKSHLTIMERVKLMKLSKNAETICEIGSYIGASACCFGASTKRQGFGKIICIDTWKNDAMSEGKRDTFKEFQNNTNEYRHFIIPIRGWSTKVIDSVKEITGTLDILFIDGDHAYEGVKADWDTYKAILKKGTIVMFHDYGWAEGVKKVVHEDVMPLVSDYDQLPNLWWGTIGEKN